MNRVFELLGKYLGMLLALVDQARSTSVVMAALLNSN